MQNMGWRLGLGALMLAGCLGGTVTGGGMDPPDATTTVTGDGGGGVTRRPLTSGSRLKVRRVTAEDGSTALLGMFDSQLNVDCTWINTAGGYRCVPFSGCAPAGRYVDAACTRAVVLQSSACEPAVYVPAFDVATGTYNRLFQVDGPVQMGTLYVGGSGSCFPSTATENYFTLSEVAWTTLVGGTAALDP